MTHENNTGRRARIDAAPAYPARHAFPLAALHRKADARAAFNSALKKERDRIAAQAVAESWTQHKKGGAMAGALLRLRALHFPTQSALARMEREERKKKTGRTILPRGRKPKAYRQALDLADALQAGADALRRLAADLDARRHG